MSASCKGGAGAGGKTLSIIPMHFKDYKGWEPMGLLPAGQGVVDLKAILDTMEKAKLNAPSCTS
jgi:hypothetical protein